MLAYNLNQVNCYHFYVIVMFGVWSSVVGSVFECLERVLMINMVSVQNPLAPFCCVLGKDTSWHFPLLRDLGKQF